VVIWTHLEQETFSREEMITRVQELIDSQELRTKRAARDLVAGLVPWALRENLLEVVPATEPDTQAAE